MIVRWFVAVLAVALVELLLLLRFAQAWGLAWIAGWIVLTVLIGGMLFRRGGLRALSRITGGAPSEPPLARGLAESGLFAIAGLLLILPGVLTDAVGFALLIPPLRRALACRIMERFQGRIHVFHAVREDSFVDVEVVSTSDALPATPHGLPMEGD